MVGVTVGPVHKPKSSAPFLRPPSRQRPFFKPDRASLPLARNIGLGPHLSDYKPTPGAAVRPAEAPFEDTPVRILEPLVYGMSDHEQAAIIGPFQALWLRASPGGCFVVDPLRGGKTGIGPLTKAVMETVDQQAILLDVKWRQDVGGDILTDLLKRFRGLAVPLGQQRGVCLAGVPDELPLGEGVLFVNRPTTFSAADGGDSAPEPLIPGGVALHNDEVLESSLFRLMELWKGACPTAAGQPGITSLSAYDLYHDEIVVLQAQEGMRIRGDMRGFHTVPHFVAGGHLTAGGVVQGGNFSWTLFWRFEVDKSLWHLHNSAMKELLETVYSGEVACAGAAFGGGGGAGAEGRCGRSGPGRDMGTLVQSNKARRGEAGAKMPWVIGSATTLEGETVQLPKLQVMSLGSAMYCITSLHVERQMGSMGGRLTANTWHPAFEALVHGVAATAKKPTLIFAVSKNNHLRITLGRCTSANPIQCFDKKLTAIVWMLTCHGAQKWPLKMVDQLHKIMQRTDTPGRGFFTLPEFVGKSHSTSVLHLVMERDTEKDVARIFAMMPVRKAEITMLDTNPAPSTKAPQKKRPAKRPRTCDSTESVWAV
jgi:hypothetical protein